MQFAQEKETQTFLIKKPDIELCELFILDANGVPAASCYIAKNCRPSTVATDR